jgi:imidazolonepropionase-like amidohydrolase
MMRSTLVVLALLTLVPRLAFADPLVAVRAARMFDGVHDRPTYHAVVLVENGRIAKVGSNLAIPAGARIVDLGDRTLLPGFIDCHTHLLLQTDPALDGGVELLREVATQTTAERTARAARLAREDLMAGITTVRDLGNCGVNGDVALRDAIARGDVIGPRMVVSTRALAPRGGQFGRLAPAAQGIVEREYATVDGPESARRAVRQAFFDGADVIKVIVGNDFATLDAEELAAIVDEAHRAGKRVAAHAISEQECRLAVAAGVDSIEHGYFLPDDVLRAMAAKKISLVPTDVPEEISIDLSLGARRGDASARKSMRAASKKYFESSARRFRHALRYGVPIAAGSDMYVVFAGRTRGEASLAIVEAYAAGGMSGTQIVRALTSDAARLLGPPLGDQVGRIEAGRFADLVAVPGDPARDPSRLEHATWVMKAGRIVRPLSKTGKRPGGRRPEPAVDGDNQ